MLKVAKSEEYIDRDQQETRHAELREALDALIELLSKHSAEVLAALSKKDVGIDARPVITQLTSAIKETNRALDRKPDHRPTVFKIERNKLGLIERVVVVNDSEGKGH